MKIKADNLIELIEEDKLYLDDVKAYFYEKWYHRFTRKSFVNRFWRTYWLADNISDPWEMVNTITNDIGKYMLGRFFITQMGDGFGVVCHGRTYHIPNENRAHSIICALLKAYEDSKKE